MSLSFICFPFWWPYHFTHTMDWRRYGLFLLPSSAVCLDTSSAAITSACCASLVVPFQEQPIDSPVCWLLLHEPSENSLLAKCCAHSVGSHSPTDPSFGWGVRGLRMGTIGNRAISSVRRHKDGMQTGTISTVIPLVTWISLQRTLPLSRTSLSLSKYLNACSQRFSNSAKCPLALVEGPRVLPARRMSAFSKQEMSLSYRGNGGIYPNTWLWEKDFLGEQTFRYNWRMMQCKHWAVP